MTTKTLQQLCFTNCLGWLRQPQSWKWTKNHKVLKAESQKTYNPFWLTCRAIFFHWNDIELFFFQELSLSHGGLLGETRSHALIATMLGLRESALCHGLVPGGSGKEPMGVASKFHCTVYIRTIYVYTEYIYIHHNIYHTYLQYLHIYSYLHNINIYTIYTQYMTS